MTLEQNKEILEEEQEGTPKAGMESKIHASREDLKAKVERTGDITRILADPAVQAVLDARGRGIEVSVVPKTEKESQEEPEPDFDEMDNRALSQYLTKKVFRAVPQALRAAMEPVMLELQNLKRYVESQEDASVNTQVKETQKRYADFNDYRAEMLKLSKENQGLDVEELYLLAKRRKGASLTVNTESEKPTGSASRSKPQKTPEMKSGKSGFDEKLKAVLEGLDFEE